MKKLSVFLCAMLLVFGLVGNVNSAYIDNLDGTVTDTETGLMWQQYSLNQLNWYAAVQYCEDLTLGGYNDWYLPNLSYELITILDTSTTPMSAPAIDLTFFPDTVATSYWTSTGGAGPNEAYGLMFHNWFGNHANSLNKSSTVYFRAVRNVIPIPSAIWLLGSGLIGLVEFRNKFRKGR